MAYYPWLGKPMSKLFMRVLGVVNLLFVIVGIWYTVGMRAIRIKDGKWPPYPPARIDWLLYFAFLALSTVLIAWLTYLSVRLIRADRKALWQTCIMFGVEIAYEWAEVTYFWQLAPHRITDRSWFWTEGMDPLAPQTAFFYPVLGLLACLALLLAARIRERPPQVLTTPLS
jgi:hypothetical protein